MREDWIVNLLSVPEMAYLGTLDGGVDCLGPRGKRWLRINLPDDRATQTAYSLHEQGRNAPLLSIVARRT